MLRLVNVNQIDDKRRQMRKTQSKIFYYFAYGFLCLNSSNAQNKEGLKRAQWNTKYTIHSMVTMSVHKKQPALFGDWLNFILSLRVLVSRCVASRSNDVVIAIRWPREGFRDGARRTIYASLVDVESLIHLRSLSRRENSLDGVQSDARTHARTIADRLNRWPCPQSVPVPA